MLNIFNFLLMKKAERSLFCTMWLPWKYLSNLCALCIYCLTFMLNLLNWKRQAWTFKCDQILADAPFKNINIPRVYDTFPKQLDSPSGRHHILGVSATFLVFDATFLVSQDGSNVTQYPNNSIFWIIQKYKQKDL